VPFDDENLQYSANETFDILLDGRVRIIQPRDGYRVNQDSLRLCEFVRTMPGARGIDLGAGCGILAIVLILEEKAKKMVAMELQESMVNMARRNTALNGLSNRIETSQGDIRQVEKLFEPRSFGLALSNPPYRGIERGRPSPSEEKNIARREQACSLQDLVRAAAYLLKPRGVFAFCQLKERWEEIAGALKAHGFIVNRREEKRNIVLVEAVTP